jgi:ABC-2 type transport system ATP-binding protein
MLRIRGLVFNYRRAEQPVLSGIDLDLPRGEILGLLGPNGAGKTTLISLISDLLPLQQGDIMLDGEPLEQARRRQPNALALVPQDYAFYPMLSVAENLQFFGGVQGLGGAILRQRIAYCSAFAQLEVFMTKRAGDLSGGLRRRLNLAIGLLADPAVLLLDEPTVGVDPQSRHFLLDSIRGLRDAGKTILYTSHYMDEVEAICDRVAIIDHGRILLAGSLPEVLRGDAPEARFRLSNPLPKQLHEDWRAHRGLRDEGGNTYALSIAGSDHLSQLLQQLVEARCAVLGMSYGGQNLEQVFMRLTHRSLRD